ncbi:hypothetical protein HDA32_005839 [Spinactinospora alkalitolerans]|uniref:Uncharacterized protein n=1 Tax=Spinactinospora alkalitolerans TaxID=687207 RepID=A0A852U3E5_9ACTN|nr:hypothetical protein [Spinactinospora alkalitolerans]NYE50719.1 hypothetical protein [Spinactinospora alkalitolerans]
MVSTGFDPSVREISEELKKLRKGVGLARPSVVMELGDELRERILGPLPQQRTSVDEAMELAGRLRETIGGLSDHERVYVETDFNLDSAHSYPTLTERQESLATALGCASKTVRRRSERALETLALLIASGPGPDSGSRNRVTEAPDEAETGERATDGRIQQGFWNVFPGARVDIVCSEIPEEERPYFASPKDRNYLRYAKFADLDTLIYVRTRLAQLCPEAVARDFAPSEYHDADADTLIVIGGPPWNAKYREFLPQLPFHFEPHPLGHDDPLVVPQLDRLTMRPCWSAEDDLLEDLAVFTRLSLTQGTTVHLLGGCLTLGVLGAAKLFLQGEHGARNTAHLHGIVGGNDFVLVTEARRVGGITDMADLETTPPLLLLSRSSSGPFRPIVNNTDRYRGIRSST